MWSRDRIPGKTDFLQLSPEVVSLPKDGQSSVGALGGRPRRRWGTEGCPFTCLWNINSKMGLMNDTRLILREAITRVLKYEIASDNHAGQVVLLPRIRLNLTESKKFLPSSPVGNDCIEELGSDLLQGGCVPTVPCFSHGRFYVAMWGALMEFTAARLSIT
eukprot:355321-Chlamydomonas_euryale.AAC.3